MTGRIVIVGGGHAGGRVAQELLTRDPGLDITVIGREACPPYERPPLSKGVLLGTATLQDILIWKPEDPCWERVKLFKGVSATALNRIQKLIQLSDGSSVSYDKAVIATGSSVRTLRIEGSGLQGIHTLRTIEDAVKISDALKSRKHLVIVGGGFIGLEIAAAATSQNIAVHVVEASDRLLSRLVPKPVGDMLAARHAAAGVDLRFATMAEKFISNSRGSVKAVRLSSGETLQCDFAVIGVGVYPEVSLAASAGLVTNVGIVTDETLQTSDPDIYACGDVASFWHPIFEQHVRVEAWKNVEDHARTLAAALLGHTPPAPTVPFFWSDQYELSMQVLGLPHVGSSVSVRRRADGSLILLHLDPMGRLVGATGLGVVESIGRDMRRLRDLIARRALIDPADLPSASVGLRSVDAAPVSHPAIA